MIYFVKSPEGPIKIGTTRQLSRRFQALAAGHGSRLEVLGVMDGSYDVERKLHHRFASSRLIGEWFSPSEELLALIANEASAWDRSKIRLVSFRIHKTFLKKLRRAEAESDSTISEVLHDILCREFKRPDLIDQVPEPVKPLAGAVATAT